MKECTECLPGHLKLTQQTLNYPPLLFWPFGLHFSLLLWILHLPVHLLSLHINILVNAADQSIAEMPDNKSTD